MEPAIQTNFNARIPPADMEAVRGFGFRWARQDALLCNTDTALAMIEDAEAYGLRTLTILYDLTKLSAMPIGCWVEWGNELDFTVKPREYRDSLDDAAAVARGQGIHLVAPCISNLDRDSLQWLKRVRGNGWPDGVVGISVHRYSPDGSLNRAHKGFDSRDDEVHALKSLCDGLPFLVTEFGYKTLDGLAESTGGFVTEADQAANIAYEWTFWTGHEALACFLYQINDGITDEEGFGIRRCSPDGTLGDWKPSAYTLQEES